jgi:3-deoxy-D-manno-octulosonate 8-phosphate phosphatase (KDO 8-P phosphatase)
MDGHGLKLLGVAGIRTAIITGRRSEIVAARARELNVSHLYQGVADKIDAFTELMREANVTAEECGYMGDDWPDLGVLTRCGFAAAPANAHPEVIARAHWVSEARGGNGAAREVCDAILRAQHRYEALLAEACGAHRA